MLSMFPVVIQKSSSASMDRRTTRGVRLPKVPAANGAVRSKWVATPVGPANPRESPRPPRNEVATSWTAHAPQGNHECQREPIARKKPKHLAGHAPETEPP